MVILEVETSQVRPTGYRFFNYHSPDGLQEIRKHITMYIRKSVGWVNQTESKATWSKFHGGIFWQSFYLHCSCHSMFCPTITIAYFIRTLIFYSMYAAVKPPPGLACTCWAEILTNQQKMVSLLAQIVFTSQFLGCRSNEWQQQGR